jgi:Tfp pilus assembly protein PilF
MIAVPNRRRCLVVALAVSLAALGALVADAILKDSRALWILGNAAANGGHFDVADRLYRRSICFDESNCVARLGLAWTLHVRGLTGQAMAELETAERMAVGPVRDLARGARMAMEADVVDGDSASRQGDAHP